MKSESSRREFLGRLGAIAAAAAVPASAFASLNPARFGSAYPAMDTGKPEPTIHRVKSPFKLSVITDEITQDFGRACEIIARDFGLGWVEIREAWNKNIVNFDDKEIAEARSILARYELRVTDLASPLFKVDWPDAPKSKFSPKRDQFMAGYKFDQQDEVLERGIHLAKAFNTSRVRCFDFWRIDDQKPYRAAINQRLLDAATKAGKQGVTLLLENEFACNTRTAAEAAVTLAQVKSPYFMLVWDPGNAAAAGEKPFPEGYALLPKDRIGHCHCKDIAKPESPKGVEWAAMGRGTIDWVGQFRAMKADGYTGTVSLETHWRGAGTPEESTRQSWAGMKDQLAKAGALDA